MKLTDPTNTVVSVTASKVAGKPAAECEYTLRAFITHQWRILIVPVNDVVIVQYHNVTLAIAALTTQQSLHSLQFVT